ncbi:transcriptional regulator NrdR [Candidatus Uhrbacteria bacterium CG_4_9_14_0_2_um_filter_41_50]|uniref:Transcriptional repressor NrdR n=1 Tax=Candidatus Uhrbacteria bacterium CG_4_9_14_0_2_um_filter_41_50 TaxID=1975031 RepID=A0A2M8ENT3_9BACT|nr:MAG: transcriptional regulator NrdR [Candidatus Uhrbacteria bacterium CG_4_10_14_3_um_filter_41_21]PIZ54925.1 MAG: transcriptional regulator NrdR [Candidatus Uhrbacteria bacterium CG_4_10_14_0_2_um_filter_41_21]PJB84594.1 MAG: transcriptional regulator NrdR [Candidatus Uhrbacteria bacterium CG_4_9_14_0_8_um_filter_41_16]PJC24414.1 MAG: transcriptional regulator NrdR [Candidatus Uhrbacteria bacterium CG_4_9_14_0_2_um_filter_41_50]PJE75151.1 MAG: transcriptional regulator NrdR [Candidatus Uhrb
MRCPVCNHKSTRVVDSRLGQDGMNVRRRRECEKDKCGYRFSTLEEVELLGISIIKRDGRKEPYMRDKLIEGLKKALDKRQYTDAEFHQLVQKIERDIQKDRAGEITSAALGEILMKHLKRFDKVAYIRFASVYYSFEDIAKFEEELKKLSRRKKKM